METRIRIGLIMTNSISKKQLREFGYLIGFGLPIIIGWTFPAIWGHSFKYWTLYVGLPAIILSFTKPILLFYPYKLWMKLGNTLGWINSHIILGLVFLIVLQPIALVLRILGYDPLRERKTNENTYRVNRKNLKIDLTRIF